MKKIIGLLLVFVMLLGTVGVLASCGDSDYSAIKKALVTAGYKASEDEAAKKAVADTTALYKEAGYDVKVYTFDKGEENRVTIVNFSSEEDIKAQVGYDSFAAKGFVRGDCFVIPYPETEEINKAVADILNTIQ